MPVSDLDALPVCVEVAEEDVVEDRVAVDDSVLDRVLVTDALSRGKHGGGQRRGCGCEWVDERRKTAAGTDECKVYGSFVTLFLCRCIAIQQVYFCRSSKSCSSNLPGGASK